MSTSWRVAVLLPTLLYSCSWGVKGSKPQIRSTEATMDFFAEEDFNFNFQNEGSSMKLSDIQSVKKMVDNAQARVIGVCANGSAVNTITVDGNVKCTKTIDESVRKQLEDAITTLSLAIPRKCKFTTWSNWSACGNTCDATQTRTRSIAQAASASAVLCAEFPLKEEQACEGTWKCRTDDPDFCNGNERWYYINSGNINIAIASYVAQDVIFYRGNGGRYPFGTRIKAMADGEVLTLNAGDVGSTQFKAGDYICGRSGAIEVLGSAPNGHRCWVPERLQGTEFVIPILRGGTQAVYIMPMYDQAVVTMWRDDIKLEEVYLQAGSTYFMNMQITQPRSIFFNSTTPILMSYVGNVGTGGVTSIGAYTGSMDYMPIPPVAAAVYGIPSNGTGSSIVAGVNTVVCSDGTVQEIRTRGSVLLSTNTMTASKANYSGPACRYETSTNGKVAAVSINDGDGLKGTMWLPLNMFRQQFILTQVVEFVAFTCVSPGRVTIQIPKGNTNGQIRQNLVGVGGGPRTFRITAPRLLRPSAYIVTSVPCFLVTDSIGSQDEVTIWGSNL